MGRQGRKRKGYLRKRSGKSRWQDSCGGFARFLPSYRRGESLGPTKAKAKLGWNPNTTTFEELVKIMVDHDMAKVASEGAAAKVRMNLAEYLEKGIVK